MVAVRDEEDPSERNRIMGMSFFIVSEAIMFGALFAQYFYDRAQTPTWPVSAGAPADLQRVPAFPIAVVLTIVLGLSAFTARNAQSAIRRNDRDGLQGWLLVTILLGIAFLGGQAYEYATLVNVDQITPSTGIYGTVFFCLTGLQGLHVLIGVLVLAAVLVRTIMGHFSAEDHWGIDGTVLYWYFVGAVWLALLLGLYIF